MFRQPLSVLLWIIHSSRCSRWPVHRPPLRLLMRQYIVAARTNIPNATPSRTPRAFSNFEHIFSFLFFSFFTSDVYSLPVLWFLMKWCEKTNRVSCSMWPDSLYIFNRCNYLFVKLERNGVYMHYRKRPYRLGYFNFYCPQFYVKQLDLDRGSSI